MAFARALLQAGVSPVLGLQGQEQVVPPLLSPRHFADYVTRYDMPLCELIRSSGCLVYVHCHGFLNAVLERFADMGVNVLHPIEAPPMGDITLAEAKRRIGERVCLEGNIQVGDVMTLERAQIVRQVRQAIADAAPGGGFILSLTATPFERVLSDRTRDNLLAMIDAALEFGAYPLDP
jgi:uroporphyrinogen-III decarboxylase